MVNYPIVVFLVPDRHLLVLFIFLWRNKVVNNMLLKLQLICELVNGVEHVVTLPIKVLLATVESILALAVFGPEALEAIRLVLQLLL